MISIKLKSNQDDESLAFIELYGSVSQKNNLHNSYQLLSKDSKKHQ